MELPQQFTRLDLVALNDTKSSGDVVLLRAPNQITLSLPRMLQLAVSFHPLPVAMRGVFSLPSVGLIPGEVRQRRGQ